MSTQTSLIVLAALVLSAASLWGKEPLSEKDLDRAVASGIEPATTVVDPTTEQNAAVRPHAEGPSVSGPSHNTEAGAEEEIQSSEDQSSLVAYRSALPIVMKRMTSSNSGPLAGKNSYSYSPLAAAQQRLPSRPFDLRGIPRISRIPRSAPVFFGR